MDDGRRLLYVTRLCLAAAAFILIVLVGLLIPLMFPGVFEKHLDTKSLTKPLSSTPYTWTPPDSLTIPNSPDGDLIRYGRELVAHTAKYLGPIGSVMPASNGMNCQNCHLNSGKKNFGNNFSAVASTYPRFRGRSGTLETIEKRVNDCIERSLNGNSLEESSREMQAFVSYIRWLGKDVPKEVVPLGAGILDLPLLDRPADPKKGSVLYEIHCVRCHGRDGEGVKNPEGVEWVYPPLWGADSYNTGAGILRLSRMAGYIKTNMPNGIRADSTELLNDEAWDLAAFINSMPRPTKDLSGDWPDIAAKPYDHPFGPFTDQFSEAQHKYGPFPPIVESRKQR